jgi:hypothetical protein
VRPVDALLEVVVLDPVADAVDHVHAPLGLVEVVPRLVGPELSDRQHKRVLDR